MRKFARIVLSLAVLVGVLSAGAGGTAVAAGEERFVYVGGAPIGIALNADGLIVTGVGDVVTEEGSARPLEGSGLRRKLKAKWCSRWRGTPARSMSKPLP